MKFTLYFLLHLTGLYYCQDVGFFNCPTVSRVPDFSYRDLSALGVAILYNSTDDIETFLNNGCDVNYDGAWRSEITTECESPLFRQLGISCERQLIYSGYTPLNLATITGNKETVRRLLQVQGINIDAASNWTSNPVFNAAINGNLDILRLLVDAGAALNIKGGRKGEETTPLIAAVISRSLPTVEYLLKSKRVNVNNKDVTDWSALGYASRYGPGDMVRLLIRFGANVNQGQSEYENTPLMLAVRDPENIDSVRQLIAANADVDKESTSGNNPLTFAVFGGNIEAVEELLKAGADINHQTEVGQSALFSAAQQGERDIAFLLIKKGADINLLSNKGFSAVYAAVEKNDLVLLQALAKAGADLDIQGTPDIDGTTGWTPLMQAAATGKVEIVRFLKNQGVDLDKADTNGDTALDLAEQNFNSEIVKILREK